MKQVKRMLAVVLSLALAFSGLTIPEKTAKAAESTVIDVTDYGADPSGALDSAEAIQKAVQAAKEASQDGDVPVVINFPEGRYDIYPDKAAQRELYISNTVGADTTYKNKKIGILLEDMKNVTVEGNNSLFMFHGKMTTFAAIGCENVTFRDYKVDFQVPTVVDITVEKVEGNTAVIYVPECYNYEISGTSVRWLSDVSPYTGQRYWTTTNSMNYTQIYDTVNGLTWRGGNPVFSNVSSIEDMGNHRLKFTYGGSCGLTVGYCYQMRPTVRDHAGTFFWKSKDVVLSNLDIYFLHGFGMVGQHSENITLENVDFETPKSSGRTTAGYADFIQMSGCKGLIDISGCTFSNPHDDPINVHGTFNQVVEKISDTQIKVRYMHNETAGFPNFFVGDQVEFMTKGNMIPVEDSVRTVTAVDGPDGQGGSMGQGSGSLTDIILTFDEAIPDEITVNNYVVENITWTPEVKIHDNVFKETPTRGILCTTRKKVVIENNTFDGMGMAGIYISNDAQGWYESGPTKDVTIRNNVFTRGKAQAIFVEPTNPTVSTTRTVHDNMTIEGNTFYLENRKVLDAKSVSNLTFKNNILYRQDPNTSVVAQTSDTELTVGESTAITAEVTGTVLSQALYSFNGCRNVVVEGNHYDGGMNVSGSRSNMSSEDVTVTDDLLSFGGTNTTDVTGKVYYESSDESVVKVTSGGVVNAVGEGKASVKVYTVVGGRKFEGTTFDYTVAAGAQVSVPTGIAITTTTETTVSENVTYTAEVAGEDAADKTVTWTVVDAQTGNATDKARIDAAGVLTPMKRGVVEVVARTVNGLEARKLLEIRMPQRVLADGVQIDTVNGTENSSLWEIEGEDRISVSAPSGGTFTTATPVNLFTVPIEGNTDNVTVTLKIEGRAKSDWEDTGLYLYQDDDNYVAIQRKNRGGSNNSVLGLVNEINGNGNAGEQLGNAGSDPDVDDIYFKLVKEGTTVTAYYSTDNQEWTQFGNAVTNNALGTGMKVAFTGCGNIDSGSPHVYTELYINDEHVPLTMEIETTDELADGVQIDTVNGTENSSLWGIEGEDRISVSAPSGGTFTTATPVNLFTVPIEGNTDNVTVTLKIEGRAKSDWEDTGLYLYQDDDNYVAIQRKNRGGSNNSVLGLVNEINGNGNAGEQLGNAGSDPDVDDIYFKLVKEGTTVTAYYSTDNQTWTQFGNAVTNNALGTGMKVAFAGCGNISTGSPHVYTELYINDKHVPLTKASIVGAPTAKDAEITYTEAQNSLAASFTLADADSAIVKWALSDRQDGYYSVIEGVEGTEITATKAMKDQYIKAAIIPVSAKGTYGEIVWTEAVLITGEGAESVVNVKSANADLASAEITGLANGFTFAKGTTAYYTTAGTSETSITVRFAAEDENAEVETLFNGAVVENNGGTLSLTSGRNLIEVHVTAQDGVTQKNYRFTISRTGDGSTALSSLAVNGNTVELTEGKLEYVYELPAGTTEATVTAQSQNAGASVAIATENGTAADGKISLVSGSNKITIVVTPETGAAPVRYTLNIKVNDSANASLSSVVFGGKVTLNETFDPDVTSYTATAVAEEVTVNAEAEEADAKISVTVNGKQAGEEATGTFSGALSFAMGENVVVITVTAPEGDPKTVYTFTVTRGVEAVQFDDAVLRSNATANSEQLPAGYENDGGAAWAFDDAAHWWHSRYQDTPADHEVESGHPSADNPIWLQTGFDGVQYIKTITYLPRQDKTNGQGRIKDYQIAVANLEDPAAVPTDDDFTVVKTGTLPSQAEEQSIILDDLQAATHVRLIVTSLYDPVPDSEEDDYVAAQRIKIFGTVVNDITLTPPAKNSYGADENELNLDGMKVEAVYSDGSKADVTGKVQITGFDPDPETTGDQTITVSYAGKSKTFVVNVEAAPVTMTGIEAAPSKTEYTLGEDLQLTVKAVYSNGTKETLTTGYTVSGYDKNKTGAQEVTVTYNGMTATFSVTVKEPAPAVDTSELEAEIAKAEALKLEDYKDGAEKDAFVKALADAKTAKDQAESQEAVDAAKAALADAAAKLVPAEPEKPVESISFDTDTDSIIIKEKKTLTVTVDPSDAKVGWSSSDDEVLTVDANGEIRALWPGEATITAKAGDKTASIKVTVYGVEKIYNDVKTADWFYDATNWAYVNDVMGGYGNGSFGPNDSLARAQFAVIMYRVAGTPEVEFEDRFPDVRADDWFADAVIWANDNGVITGYTDSGMFGPADKITREQIAAILYRYAKAQGYDVTASDDLAGFPDADKVNGFAQDAMKWAVGVGLIKGDNGRLNPQGNANRAEAATLIWRFCGAYEDK